MDSAPTATSVFQGRILVLRTSLAAVLVLAASLLFPNIAYSNEAASESTSPVSTAKLTPSPIPLATLSAEQLKTHELIRDQEIWAQSDTSVAEIKPLFATEKARLSTSITEMDTRRLADMDTTDLKEFRERWETAIGTMNGWAAELERTVASREKDLKHLLKEREVWNLSLENAVIQDVPHEVTRSVQSILDRVIEAEETSRRQRNEALLLLTGISEIRTDVTEHLEEISDELTRRRNNNLKAEQIPLWLAAKNPNIDRFVLNQTFNKIKRNRIEVFEYVRDQPRAVAFHVLLGLAILTLLLLIKAFPILRTGDDQQALDILSTMTRRPLATAILLSGVLTEPLHPQAPEAWLKYMTILLALALVRLLPGLLHRSLRAAPTILAGLFILHRVSITVPSGNLVNKLLLLSLTIATTTAMFWGAKALGRVRLASPSGWLHLAHIATGAGTVLGAFSIVLSIVGETGWAFHLSEGILTSAFSAMLLWAAVLLFRAFTIVLLNTNAARNLQMVLREGQSICSGCMKVYLWAAALAWGYYTLRGFGWLTSFLTFLHRLLHWEMEFGNITLTPMNFLYFFFAIWVSLQISKLLRFILEKDVIPRTSLPRGVPETISKAVHYTTLLGGVFIALSAIGIDGSSLALILGALGFGISFGLQNVVNNFVSGLILLFERPIRVGDKVQIGEMDGVVGEIGIRATTVHTWDGADVIVPNANLISDDIINWTFSDHKRRIEVNVGVAYGVDPETVLALLPSLATAHPEVLPNPEPVALFRGFGDSSLDFSLRCWTTAAAPNIQSDIGISVHRALVDAGIEIPFPQQDLHLKSVDESIHKELLQVTDKQRSVEVIASSDE